LLETRLIWICSFYFLLFFFGIEILYVWVVLYIQVTGAAVIQNVGIRMDPVVRVKHFLKGGDWYVAVLIRVFFDCSWIVFSHLPALPGQ
jgi:uncharacterized membrane protein